MSGARILVVEDDTDLQEMLKTNLESEGFYCDVAVDGEQGLRSASAVPYAVIILDRVLPKRTGTEVLTELRRGGNFTPVIFLTSKSEEVDKIVGLELGADDYVTKPFQFGELIARIRALLRRTRMTQETVAEGRHSVLTFGGLSIDTRTRKVMLDDAAVRLTALEYDLLLHFASHPDVPQTREMILQAVWQTNFLGYEDSVNTAVKRLRQKVEPDPGNPEFIQTVRGVGYVFSRGTK